MLGTSLLAIADDDDDKGAAPDQPSAQPSLNEEQQRAVGIVTAHPLSAKVPQRIAALGLVLDETTLVADIGEASAAAAMERSASTELARLHALYAAGAGASLKMLEAAQAEQAKAQAEAQVAGARLALRWGPLAVMPNGERQKMIDASASGRGLLLRADLPGRHILGVNPSKALVDVDGVQVPGRVLGTLRQAGESQSVGLLIEVPQAPPGWGPGARVPVALLTGERAGLWVPNEAVLYDENGAYVYKQPAKKNPAEKARYVPAKVTLLLPLGDGWLVDGIDDDDNIVGRGTGVLWSLQGVGAQPQDDDDD
jgi:hypothetical protein